MIESVLLLFSTHFFYECEEFLVFVDFQFVRSTYLGVAHHAQT